jgi:hypothetical protein
MDQPVRPSRTGRLLRAVGLGSSVLAAALVGLQTEPGCDWLAGVVQQGVQGITSFYKTVISSPLTSPSVLLALKQLLAQTP